MTEDTLRERVAAAIGRHHTIEEEIGRGGMSVVYRARDLRLNRTVAIKVLPPELAYDPAVRVRFTREAQTSAQLAHPHIVPIYDVGESEGIAWFVMSLVTGGNLASLLAHEPRQPVEEVRRILREIADALAYAHARGVIHRDIKPDNILLDRDSGHAMVTDFGIARAMEAGTRLTVTGIAVGTPTYMSPEQAEGDREIDGRSDLYSLGVVAYQMLTGRVPFTGGNSMALLLKHITEQPRSIADLRPDAPKALREAVERAMMKSPEDRWPTAAALRDALASGGAPAPAWRGETREPVRYASPRPEPSRPDPSRPEPSRRDRAPREPARAERASVVPRTATPDAPRALVPVPGVPGELVRVPEHLAALTPAQVADLRLWHGRIDLLDRIKSMRRYTFATVGAILFASGMLAGVEEVPPLILGPLVPMYMARVWWLRRQSLRDAGLRMRRVLFALRSARVFPRPVVPPTEQQLLKLVPREVLESPAGRTLRRAVEDRAAIVALLASLPKADRAMLPEVAPTVNALVERVAHLAQALHRLDQGIDPRQIADLDARLAELEREPGSPERERRLALFQRQRDTLDELVQRRLELSRQLESAGLALGNLRLDLIKLRSSGMPSALSDVSTATREARALSRDIGVVLHAAAELRNLDA